MKKLRLFYSRLPIRFKYWFVGMLASVILVGFSYVAVQQNYRQNANDPQVQYAQDISAALEQGASPEALGGNSPVDPRKSLGLFLVVFDENKKSLAGNLEFDGKTPTPPDGAFNAAKNSQQRFTWQPQGDARIAVVMQHYKGKQPGYVVVGRSMKEVEKREQQLLLMSIGAFLAMLAVVTMATRIGMSRRLTATPKAAPAQPALEFDDASVAAPEAPTVTEAKPVTKKTSNKPKKATGKKSKSKSSRS